MTIINNLDVIQEKIGYKFNEKFLLIQAFTRKSFAEENFGWESNEQLEFIGDKALDFVVVKKLTSLYGFISQSCTQSLESIEKGENFSANNIVHTLNIAFKHTEGEMTEIKKQVVQTRFLASAIEKLGFENYLLMSKGDIKNNVQNEPRVKEDLCEAIIGAVAIDSSWNIKKLELVADKMLNLDYHIRYGVDDGIDYISYVENWYQREYGQNPEYIFDNNSDAFTCTLTLKGFNCSFEGCGYSKISAEKLAAKRAYDFLQQNKEKCNTIASVVGSIDFNSSVNKLQVLADKKIISGLDYEYRTSEGTNGNPIWHCRCKVDGLNDYVEYGHSKKVEAKKAAAYTVLQILIKGFDKMAELFIDHGSLVSEPLEDIKTENEFYMEEQK